MKFKIAISSLLLTLLAAVPGNGVADASRDVGIVARKSEAKSAIRAKEKYDWQEILDENARVEKVAGGLEFTEGPLWHPEGFLLFSDIPGNTIYKWKSNKNPNKTLEIFRRPSGNANGNALDKQGRLITAEHGNRRLSRTLDNGEIVTLAARYEGKRLNSPNDVAIKSDGSIYFTDPPYGIKPEREELGFYGVYRLAPDGTLTLLVRDFVRPNGIAFSPDEKKLYVGLAEKLQTLEPVRRSSCQKCDRSSASGV